MILSLKCYTYLFCFIIITLYREALAKDSTYGELDKTKPNLINNGTLIQLAKHLSDKVKKGELFFYQWKTLLKATTIPIYL